MNLQEFIDYRKKCPVCQRDLIINLYSDKSKPIKKEGDRLIIRVELRPLKRSKSRKPTAYLTSYSFGLNDNSFKVEFYDNAYAKDPYQPRKNVPDFLRNKFIDFHNNLKKIGFKFFVECSDTACQKYKRISENFIIDLKSSTYSSLEIKSEHTGLAHPLPEGYRIFLLHSYPSLNKSQLDFWKDDIIPRGSLWGGAGTNVTHLYLPLIPLVSAKETVERLNNLIIYT